MKFAKPKTLIIALLLASSLTATAQEKEYNPYQSIGKKGKIVTLSNGKYVEVFDYDTIQRVGSVLFNIRIRKIVRLLNTDSIQKKASDNSSASRWYSPDPLAYEFFSWSPYNFSFNNPIRYNDPDGLAPDDIIGVTKKDAQKFQDDLNAMLADKAYDNFRSLISVKGKKFEKIDDAAFNKSIEGLNEDQTAFAKSVFSAINSNDKHVIEYAAADGKVSSAGAAAFGEGLGKIGIKTDKGLSSEILITLGGSGVTTKTSGGTHSVVFEGLPASSAGGDYYNSDTKTFGNTPGGRSSTAGHEVFGHGRSLALGRGDAAQHADAIRVENLILRVMGFGNIQRDGTGHGDKSKVSEPSKLPGF